MEIDRSRAEVAAFAADPSNAPRWYAHIRRVEWRTAPPLAVGSRFLFEARFLGRALETTSEVLAYEPNERPVMATSSGPFAMETRYTWADVPGCRAKMRRITSGRRRPPAAPPIARRRDRCQRHPPDRSRNASAT